MISRKAVFSRHEKVQDHKLKQDKIPVLKSGDGHEVSSLVEELFTFDYFWKKESSFSSIE